MKPDEFKHGVQRGINSRSVGSAPNLGPVPQLSRIGRVREGIQRRRDGRSERYREAKAQAKRRRTRRRVIAVWSVVLGLVALIALGLAFFLWLQPMLQRDRDTTEQDRKVAESRIRKASRFAAPDDREALALVRRALAVRDPAKVAEMIRLGPLTSGEVVDRLRRIQAQDGEPTGTRWLSSVDKNGMSLEGVEVRYGMGDKVSKRLAFLTPDDVGVWKLDFPAFDRLVVPSWEKLLAGNEPSGVVRVNVARDRYYNGPFLDEQQWVAYGMASPDMNELLVGYCKRFSDQHRALEMMWTSDEIIVVRATLEIRRVEGADPRQFEIVRVLAEDWVTGEQPFDEFVTLGAKP
jgi:hypothetical protein